MTWRRVASSPRLSGASARCDVGHAACARAASAAAPARSLLPITLAGDADRGAVLANLHRLPWRARLVQRHPAYHVPKLGGQNADYIEVALQGYRRGTRSHPTMQAQAATLSDQDIADIAAYFSTYEGEPAAGKSSASAVDIEAGKRAAVACQQCHGADGRRRGAAMADARRPARVVPQQALKQYQTGQRADMLMAPLVKPLDSATIAQLAAYFASQPFLHGTEPK